MKKFNLVLLLLVLFWFKSTGQQTFFTFFPDSLNAYFGDVVEDKYGNFLAVGQQRILNDFSTNRGTLWRITPLGDTLTRNFTHGADTSTGFSFIIQTEDYYCTIFGGITIRTEQTHGYTMLLHLDSSLNEVGKKFILPSGSNGASTQVIAKIKASYYCLGNSVTSDGIPRHSIMKLNKDFDITDFLLAGKENTLAVRLENFPETL